MAAQASCCLSGFQWDGTPTGAEDAIANNKAYVAGDNSDVAVLVIADLFGWTFINERLLCDHYAAEVGATVYMPDFFGGQVIDPTIVGDVTRWGEIDLKAWSERNSKENRWHEIKECAEALKKKYKKVGVIGYCYGGWSGFRLGSEEFTPRLVDCISTAHPTYLTKEEIAAIGVPVQIIAPEHDPVFTHELKTYARETIPTKNVPFDYQHFPGVGHAFATRGKLEEEGERRSMLRAKRAQVAWMREWLHAEE